MSRESTDSTSIHRDGNKYVVTAMGGYDGYLRHEFDFVEDAVDFVASLWSMDSSTIPYQQMSQERGTGVRVLRKLLGFGPERTS